MPIGFGRRRIVLFVPRRRVVAVVVAERLSSGRRHVRNGRIRFRSVHERESARDHDIAGAMPFPFPFVVVRSSGAGAIRLRLGGRDGRFRLSHRLRHEGRYHHRRRAFDSPHDLRHDQGVRRVVVVGLFEEGIRRREGGTTPHRRREGGTPERRHHRMLQRRGEGDLGGDRFDTAHRSRREARRDGNEERRGRSEDTARPAHVEGGGGVGVRSDGIPPRDGPVPVGPRGRDEGRRITPVPQIAGEGRVHGRRIPLGRGGRIPYQDRRGTGAGVGRRPSSDARGYREGLRRVLPGGPGAGVGIVPQGRLRRFRGRIRKQGQRRRRRRQQQRGGGDHGGGQRHRTRRRPPSRSGGMGSPSRPRPKKRRLRASASSSRDGGRYHWRRRRPSYN
mmetsp:Transcript_12211/g.35776  ORF Transcript_12211/g.35776 Transcript_12211/m.35776 type:complete len:390 (+) Transcript_12211:347-1516(+)